MNALALPDLDPDRLAREIAAVWPGPERFDGLRLLQVRRSASRRRHPHPLSFAAELQLAGGCQRVHGKSWRDGASAAAYAQACRVASAAPTFGPAVLHLPTLDMVLWSWPNDPALPQLPRLLAAEGWPGAASGPVELLRHEPECRATLRSGGVYAKTFADDSAISLYERFQRCWTLAQHDPDAALVAQPLRVDPMLRTLWQAETLGRPLLAHATPQIHAAALGRALARLHASPRGDAVARPPGHWAQEIVRRGTKLVRALPMLADNTDVLVHKLIRREIAAPPSALSLIHGDCHADQVSVHEDRIVLFDFDEFALGDAMEDLAALLVRLAPRVAPSVATAFEDALLAAYRADAPERFDAQRLRWHRAVQELLQAARAFVFQRPGWPLAAAAHLWRAEEWAS